MENNELFLTNEEVLDNRFDNMNADFEGDLTLDNVNPWLLIATYNNLYAA